MSGAAGEGAGVPPNQQCSQVHAPVAGRTTHGQVHEPEPGRGAREPGEPHHAHPAPHTHSVHGLEGYRPRQRRALLVCVVLTLAAMVAEIAGGIWTGSLMLLADAAHMLSHSVSLVVSYVAIRVAARPLTARSHYGLHRAEILASFLNGLGLLVFTGWIVYEAVLRLAAPQHVLGTEMIAIAAFGLVVNLLTAWILGRTGAEDLNTRSALLHMLGDLFSSVAIVAGGAVLLATDWLWIDPVLSMLVAGIVLWWAFGLLRESTSILLERAPEGVDAAELARTILRDVPRVRGVHDLHVWEITSGYVCLTAHVVVDDAPVSEVDGVRIEVCNLLWRRYRVAHVTLQMETG